MAALSKIIELWKNLQILLRRELYVRSLLLNVSPGNTNQNAITNDRPAEEIVTQSDYDDVPFMSAKELEIRKAAALLAKEILEDWSGKYSIDIVSEQGFSVFLEKLETMDFTAATTLVKHYNCLLATINQAGGLRAAGLFNESDVDQINQFKAAAKIASGLIENEYAEAKADCHTRDSKCVIENLRGSIEFIETTPTLIP